jgi:phosphatidylglycerophosphatase A
MPIAPGTWGSLPPVVAFALLAYCHVSGAVIAAVMAAFIVAASVACVACVPAVAALAGKTDPGEVVVDEVAGQAVAFLIAAFFLPADLSLKQVLFVAGLGFFLFRVLDITKPWPIRKLEALPEGWGVLADDLLAGLFAAIVLCVCIRLWVTG